MHINFALIGRVLARAFMNTANRQRWTLAKVLNYAAVVVVALAIAWSSGQLQALQERSLTWVLLFAAAGIVFVLEMVIQSYVAAYDVGEESGKAADAPKADLSGLKKLYSEGQAIRMPDRQNFGAWSRRVSEELGAKLPTEQFGFDSASDHLGTIKGLGARSTPSQHLEVRLRKLRLIVMRTEKSEDVDG